MHAMKYTQATTYIYYFQRLGNICMISWSLVCHTQDGITPQIIMKIKSSSFPSFHSNCTKDHKEFNYELRSFTANLQQC